MREYRASELGACWSRQVHKQLGSQALDPPATLQAAFDRGNTHEDACVAEMRSQGWKVYGEQDEVWVGSEGPIMPLSVMGPKPDWLLTGHLDGRVILPGDVPSARPRVLEVKAPAAWAKFERAYKTGVWVDPLTVMYAWQTSVYMVATGLECVVACYEPDSTNESSYQHGLRWFVIETPTHDEAAIIARVSWIDALTSLPSPPSDCEPGMRDDWSCPFRHLHGAPERPEVDDYVLDTLVGLYAAEKALRDRADEAMKRHREQIDLHLGLADTVETANSIATRVATTRTTLDKRAMEADGIKVAAYETAKVSTSIRVTVKGDNSPDVG